MYNAVIYHYYDMGRDLSLKHVLALEARALPLDSTDAIYMREVKQVASRRLMISTFFGTASNREWIGDTIVESPGVGIAFHVIARHQSEASQNVGLITSEGEVDDDEFLRTGNTFRY